MINDKLIVEYYLTVDLCLCVTSEFAGRYTVVRHLRVHIRVSASARETGNLLEFNWSSCEFVASE